MEKREAVDPHKKPRKPKYRESNHSVKAVANRSECCLENFRMPNRILPDDATPEDRKAYRAKTKYSELDRGGLQKELEKLLGAEAETLEAEISVLQTECARRWIIADVERDYLARLNQSSARIQERLDEQKKAILRELRIFIQKHGAKKAFDKLKEKHALDDKQAADKSKEKHAPNDDHSVSSGQSLVAFVSQRIRALKLSMEISFETKFGAEILFSREGLELKLIISYRGGSMGQKLEHHKTAIEREIEEVTPKLDELDCTMQMIGAFLSAVKPAR